MCGIAAVVDMEGGLVDRNLIARMTHALVHRGPDDEGYFSAPGVAFGFRRLAIIDLSSGGHQPMATPDGNLRIVFNGEIYNYLELREELTAKGHRFQSASDTEVILYAYKEWGIDCLSRLNGMWAFCLWDAACQRVFCARDRMGVKPFYYTWDGKRLIIASEIKAILETRSVRPRLNAGVAFDFLVKSLSDHTADTFFSDIKQLLPGHCLILDLAPRSIEFRRYWQLPLQQEDSALDPAEAVAKFASLFQDAVRLRLRADVPVGSCLSGGLDSSSIVCTVNDLMRSELGWSTQKIQARQRTFSADFDDALVSEREYMNLVLERTRSQGHFVNPTPEGLWSELPRIIYHQEAPFNTSSVYAQWNTMRLAAQSGVKVILDGQGADELLGGYTVYLGLKLVELLAQGKVCEFLESFYGTLLKTNLGFRGIARVAGRGWVRGASDFWQFTLRNRLRPALRWTHKTFRPEQVKPVTTLRTQQRNLRDALVADLTRDNLPALLRYEDRNSMAFSLEARLPFMDYRLVEFVAALPDKFKVHKGETKSILRRAVKGRIPEPILQRRDKKGFITPHQRWMESSRPKLRSYFENGCLCRPLVQTSAILKRLNNNRCLSSSEATDLWRFVTFEQWLRTFRLSL